MLHKRLYDRCDMSFEYEPPDMHCWVQRLHNRHHHDLHQRSVQRGGWRGIVLHERLRGWGSNMPVEHEPSDLRARHQRLHRLHIHDLRLVQWRDLHYQGTLKLCTSTSATGVSLVLSVRPGNSGPIGVNHAMNS
jgi:hypothetical protein